MKKIILPLIFLLSLLTSICFSQNTSEKDTVVDLVLRTPLKQKTVHTQTQTKEDSNSEINYAFEIGQGFRFQDFHHPEIYTVAMQFNPSISTADGKIRAGASTMAVYFNGITEFFGGARIGYRVYNNKNVSVYTNIEQLFGEKDRWLFGGGVNLEYGPLIVSVSAHQEYTNKEFWFTGGAGVSLEKIIK